MTRRRREHQGRGSLTLRAAAAALVLLGTARVAAADEARCEPQSIGTKYPGLAGKTFQIGVSAADKPNSFRDESDPDKIDGFDPDYARAAFACIGAPVEFAVGGWSGLMPALVAGRTDMMWDQLYYTPERAKSVDFVIYSSARSAVVVPKGNPKNVHGPDDLCGLRAVTQVGSIEVEGVQRQNQACAAAHKPEIVLEISPDRPSSLRQLQNGRVDAYIGIGSGVTYDPALYEIAYTFNSGLKVGIGVRKGAAELERALYDAVKILQANGTARQIYEKYALNPDLSEPTAILTQ